MKRYIYNDVLITLVSRYTTVLTHANYSDDFFHGMFSVVSVVLNPFLRQPEEQAKVV